MKHPVLRTKLCEMLGVEYPILLAGMGSFGACTPPALVAAVSEAGGMGVFGGTGLTPDELRDNIREIRKLTGRPIGVDLLLPEKVAETKSSRRSDVREQIRTTYPQQWEFVLSLKRTYGLPDEHVEDEYGVITPEAQMRLGEIALEEKVELFAAALGTPGWLVPRAHAQGMKVLGLAGNARHGIRQKAAGVDLVVATGTEAGGHTGRIATMPLIPQMVDAVAPVPVIAAGGIGDGRQVAAALNLGAVGVWVGTAFLVADECGIPGDWKDYIVGARSEDFDMYKIYTGKPMRGLKNEITAAWTEAGIDALPVPFQKVLMDDFQRAAFKAGRHDLEANPGGQVGGMVKSRQPAAKIMQDLVEGAVEAIHASIATIG
jgi:NAD(P)H-dependent flavin oxidoreductase YrpB (nitropropane dioxygenase family)